MKSKFFLPQARRLRPQCILLAAFFLMMVGAMPAWGAPKPKGKTKLKKGTTMNPKRVYDIHNIYVWGGAGYSGMVSAFPLAEGGLGYEGTFSNKFVGGGGGLLGLGYEYKYKHFLLSVGPEFRLFSSADKFRLDGRYDVLMSEYDQVKHYEFSDMQETQAIGQLMVPILFGGTFDKVYFKAGAKIGYTLLHNYKQQGFLTTTITDPNAYNPIWGNIPSHNLEPDVAYSCRGKNPFGWDVSLSAEVGVNLDQLLGTEWREANEEKDRPLRLRVALFVDYGLNNMGIGNAGVPFAMADEQTVAITSIHATEWASTGVHSLMVGLKFTAMLQMNKEKKLVKKSPILNVYTIDAATEKPLQGALVLAKAENGRVRKKTTNGKGLAKMGLAEGNYIVTAQRSGYYDSEELAIYHEEDNERIEIAMHAVPPPPAPEPEPAPVPEHEPIIIHNLYFASNETTILPSSEEALAQLYQLLTENPEMRIRIIGHTDDVGTDIANLRLSRGRAESVKQNMVERGISPSRIETEGRGEREPIVSNDTEEGRAQNRRVEFVVL